MKLYGSGSSPYVRKTLMVMRELDLTDRVEVILQAGGPLDDPGPRAKAPLRKIPFIETDDGEIYYDSRVVAEALLQEGDPAEAERLLPAGGKARLDALTRHALGDGVCDSALMIAYEKRFRPEELHWPVWHDVQWGKIASALDHMETRIPPADRFDLGDIAWTAALGYLDMRFDDKGWRDNRPGLASWFETAKSRPSAAAVLT